MVKSSIFLKKDLTTNRVTIFQHLDWQTMMNFLGITSLSIIIFKNMIKSYYYLFLTDILQIVEIRNFNHIFMTLYPTRKSKFQTRSILAPTGLTSFDASKATLGQVLKVSSLQ